MKHFMKQILFVGLGVSLMISACTTAQPEENSKQLEDQLATMVSLTLTALPTNTPAPTNTPLPTPTETLPPATFDVSPTVLPIEMVIPTAKPDYACDIVKQKPFDDTELRRGDPFDIEWTLVNSGTQKWEKGTSLIYQTGPEMTDVKEVALPQLKPGEKYEIILDATAPSERDLHIMVWAVVGPGSTKNSEYWMCYPYIRIVVKK